MMNEPLTPEGLAALVVRAHEANLRGQSFERLRVVSQKSTHDALPDTELGRALRGHVAALLWARLAEPYAARAAEASAAPHPELARVEAPHGSVTELRELVVSGSANLVQDALEALPRASGALREALAERAEARREITARLGAVDPFPTIPAAAARFFEATRDLARSVVPREPALATLLPILRGTQLTGLPARLSHAWLRDALPHFATPRLAGAPLPRLLLQRLPRLLGVTSFARALRQLGESVVLGAPLAPPEWVRRVDGTFFAPARTGLLFASLMAEPAFLARATDASAGERDAFARAVHVAALFEARALAAHFVEPEAAEAELFATPLPRGLRGVLPRSRDDAAMRFAAYLDQPALHDAARSLFDEDWFRNPRSRSWAMLPPPAVSDDPLRLTRSFEAACG